jgi:hypothetical protein
MEFVRMNAIKLALGILFVIPATKTWTLASAQDVVKSLAQASLRQADPSEHHDFLPNTPGNNTNRVWAGDRLNCGR